MSKLFHGQFGERVLEFWQPKDTFSRLPIFFSIFFHSKGKRRKTNDRTIRDLSKNMFFSAWDQFSRKLRWEKVLGKSDCWHFFAFFWHFLSFFRVFWKKLSFVSFLFFGVGLGTGYPRICSARSRRKR